MKIYTKTGDKGMTSLYGGSRVPKYHVRIASYGTLDELNANIGMLRDQHINENSSKTLLKIQHELFAAGSELATPIDKELDKDGNARLKIQRVNTSSIEFLEKEMDKMNKDLPQMTHFVLPGGHPTVSICHISRCVCRRAERIVALLGTQEEIRPEILIYLNRLSDYLFVLARKLTYENNAQEIKWVPEKND